MRTKYCWSSTSSVVLRVHFARSHEIEPTKHELKSIVQFYRRSKLSVLNSWQYIFIFLSVFFLFFLFCHPLILLGLRVSLAVRNQSVFHVQLFIWSNTASQKQKR